MTLALIRKVWIINWQNIIRSIYKNVRLKALVSVIHLSLTSCFFFHKGNWEINNERDTVWSHWLIICWKMCLLLYWWHHCDLLNPTILMTSLWPSEPYHTDDIIFVSSTYSFLFVSFLTEQVNLWPKNINLLKNICVLYFFLIFSDTLT
jgi:predicted membrane protein